MSNTKHQPDLINICEMLLRKTYSINAGISKEESSTFVGGGGKLMKLKVSREKKILNMRLWDEKSVKTKSKVLGFVSVFKKIDKSDKLLSRNWLRKKSKILILPVLLLAVSWQTLLFFLQWNWNFLLDIKC